KSAVTDKQNQLWYTRRGENIRGPFPLGMIRRHILLGRILHSDELSSDKIEWNQVSERSDLFPKEMNTDLSVPENEQRLNIAFMREDERRSGDRRSDTRYSSDRSSDQRGQVVRAHDGSKERRVVEDEATVRHRAIKTAYSHSVKNHVGSPRFRIMILAIIMLAVIFVSVFFRPDNSSQHLFTKCLSGPSPNVDWNNCGKEGVDLAGISLAGAKLRSVSFGGANLTETILIGADMSYANFANSSAVAAKFQRAVLVGAVLRNANFSGVDLSHADLSFAILNETNLSNANLNGANLSHVVMTGANIEGVNFEGAKLDMAVWIDNSVCAPGSIGRCIPMP
ncbi:MAG: pentapeptide repeat-containing protein, partial [Thiohalomonadales bacterium]